MKKGFLNHLLLTAAAFFILTVVFAGCGSSGGSSNGPTGSNLSNAVTTLAGLPPYVNGTGSAANFNSPSSVATDGTNLYVADQYNNLIRKIVISTGVVTTLAGSPDAGSSDGTGSSASFNSPAGITIDSTKTNLYVADWGNNLIRKIVIATGAVSTVAGASSGESGGVATVATFSCPAGIAVDSTGTNLYITDVIHNAIWKVVIATGVVSLFAGSDTASGHADGTGTSATFSYPSGIVIDPTGTNLYVTDTNNCEIRKIEVGTAVVSTLAGSPTSGYVDGNGTAAGFSYPEGIIIDSTGTNLYVSDTWNNKIRKIVISSVAVSTIAGSGVKGYSDGTGTVATFNFPKGITTDGTNLYVADDYNNEIRKIVIATNVVTTLAGLPPDTNGTGSAARFNKPEGIAIDPTGTNLYMTDSSNNEIRRMVIATGVVTTLAGSTSNGHSDGTGTAARFNEPKGIAIDPAGANLYVADYFNNEIRKIVISSGVVTTLAGSTTSGSSDGTGSAASFNEPRGIVIDPAGANLYVTDWINCGIRKIVIATGVVSTLAGSGAYGHADGTGTAASFSYPTGITIDPTGANLYVADTDNNEIRKIVIATGVVSTLAGSTTSGHADGKGSAAGFYYPKGITTDGTSLYVADAYNNLIRKIVIASGTVSTIAGSTSYGYGDGTGTAARFYSPSGITIDSTGTHLYVSDTDNNMIRVIK